MRKSLDELSIFLEAVPAIAGDPGFLAVLDSGLALRIESGLEEKPLVIGAVAFDLVGCGRAAPEEIFAEAPGHGLQLFKVESQVYIRVSQPENQPEIYQGQHNHYQ